MSPRSQASHALRTTSTLSSDFATPSGRERASPCWGITSTFSRDIARPVSADPHVVSRICRKPKEERGGMTCSESFLAWLLTSPQGKAWVRGSVAASSDGSPLPRSHPDGRGGAGWEVSGAAGPSAFHPETLFAEVARRAVGQEEPPDPESVPRIRRAVEAPVPRVAVRGPHVYVGHRSTPSPRAFA